MARRRRSRRASQRTLFRSVVRLIVAIPLAYLLAALVGALVPVNAGWREPPQGTTIYLVSNGIHTDLILPEDAQGLDWRPVVPRRERRPEVGITPVPYGFSG